MLLGTITVKPVIIMFTEKISFVNGWTALTSANGLVSKL